MFMKIMAAIDGTETSMEALMEAKHIAVSQDASLCIVYAVADSDENDESSGLKLLEQAKSIVGNGLNVDTRLVHAEAEYGLNGIAEALAEAANEWHADLVVVGTANRRGLERFVIGSVAEQVVSKVDASVLVVRPRRSAD
ncbi:UspA [Candidatus Nitrospira inopinata]|jgi:nucleotide-binding universal stress UspA family protein|uniref:UspA n=2 Tax=Candidatus Nitrospira inopinata TaxID=1715989 RepID=A0A0S4KTX5_9BACT|nr:UspA [Candidatus Nitrospira inopinata]